MERDGKISLANILFLYFSASWVWSFPIPSCSTPQTRGFGLILKVSINPHIYISILYTLYIYYISIIYLLYIYYISIIYLLYIYYISIIYIYIYYISIIYIHYISIIYTLYIYYIYIIYLLYIHYISIIYTLYIYYIYIIYLLYIHYISIIYIISILYMHSYIYICILSIYINPVGGFWHFPPPWQGRHYPSLGGVSIGILHRWGITTMF